MPIEPDDAELIEEAIKSFMLDVHVCMPAKCVAYDATKQRGDFQPMVNGSVKDVDGNNVFETRPVVQNVPVFWLRAGGYGRHNPLAKDDCGVLFFSEDAYGHWRDTGELSDPGDVTRHSIAYPFFQPGIFPDAQPVADAPASGEAVESVPGGGHVSFRKVGGSDDFVALAAKTSACLQGIIDAINNAIPASGASDGGAGLLTSIKSGLTSLSSSVAATSLKSD
jgi:hypothetical protein